MSLVGAFMGTDQADALTAGKQQSDAALKTGFNAGQAGYDQAAHQFDQYNQTGGAANQMYANATGVNGQAAYNGVANNFMTGDPFRQSNEDFANKQLLKTFNARGGAYGGNAMLAAARGSLERGSTDWNNWLNRLQGQAGQGFSAAGSTAGLLAGKGNQAMNYGETQANNDNSFANAMAASKSIPINNLTGLFSTAVKGSTPTASGGTAFGNMASGLTNMMAFA